MKNDHIIAKVSENEIDIFSIGLLISKLSEKTWSLRVAMYRSKENEVSWRITFVDPKDSKWHEAESSDLVEALLLSSKKLGGEIKE